MRASTKCILKALAWNVGIAFSFVAVVVAIVYLFVPPPTAENVLPATPISYPTPGLFSYNLYILSFCIFGAAISFYYGIVKPCRLKEKEIMEKVGGGKPDPYYQNERERTHP